MGKRNGRHTHSQPIKTQNWKPEYDKRRTDKATWEKVSKNVEFILCVPLIARTCPQVCLLYQLRLCWGNQVFLCEPQQTSKVYII